MLTVQYMKTYLFLHVIVLNEFSVQNRVGCTIHISYFLLEDFHLRKSVKITAVINFDEKFENLIFQKTLQYGYIVVDITAISL